MARRSLPSLNLQADSASARRSPPSLKAMAGQRKKNDKYSPVVEAELDLHGYYAEEAKRATLEFLNEANKNGSSRVRIIVGKGNRSQGGRGVLGDVVKSLLNQEGYDHTYAKIQDGGEGALEVSLRSS